MLRTNNQKYLDHKNQAKRRGIDFLLTFEQWWNIWQESGKWDQRGTKQGQYCMSRYGDIGPYSLDNVFIQTHSKNLSDAHTGKTPANKGLSSWNKGVSMTDKVKSLISDSLIGHKQTEQTKQKKSESMKLYWKNKNGTK